MASDAVVNLVVDATRAEGETRVALVRIVNDAERSAPAINLRVEIPTRRIEREFGILGTRIDAALGQVDDSIRTGFVNLSGELSGLVRSMERSINRLETSMDRISGSLDDIGRSADRNLDEVSTSARQAQNDTDRLGDSLRKVGSMAATVAKTAAAMGLISTVAAGAVPLVAGLVTSLTNILPAGAAAVSGLVALKGATTTLKVALIGIPEAIEAVFSPDADPAALAEALERLAPEARAFVQELNLMKPALDGLRLDIQNRVFEGFAAQLRLTAGSLLPSITTASQSFADTLNAMGIGVAKSAREVGSDGSLGRALGDATGAFDRLKDVPGNVLESLVRLADGGGGLLNRFADSVARVAESITDKLERAAESGALEDAINDAGDAIAQLGRIGSNVFGALGNIMDAAGGSGDGLFGSLERITQAFEDLTASREFEEVLSALLDTGSVLAQTVLPLIADAFSELAPVITELAPHVQDLISLLGDELGEIIPVLGPILLNLATALGTAMDALGPWLDMLGDLVVAVLPVLNPLLTELNRIFEELSPVIALVAEELSSSLVPLIGELIPIIADLVGYFADLVETMMPLLEVILPPLLDLLGLMAKGLVLVYGALGPLIGLFLNAAISLADNLVGAVTTVIGWLGDFKDAVVDLGGRAFNGVILPLLRATVQLLQGDFSGAWRSAREAAGNAMRLIGEAVVRGLAFVFEQMHALPGRVVGAMGSLGQVLFASGAALVNGFISGITSRLSAVASAASSIVGAARDYFPFSPAKKGPFSGKGWTFFSGQSVIDDFAKGLYSRRGTIDNAFSRTLGPRFAGPDTVLPGYAGTSPDRLASLVRGSFAVGAPNVFVTIGNEAIDQYVTVRVDQAAQDRDRQAAQGVRI